ncbi:hypothetical protein CsSME_00050151 [Camellia sinensis var. sinensis]
MDLRKERTTLDPVLSNDALIMPCKGILKACAMSLPVLSEISTVMEFDFSKPISPCFGKVQVEFTEPGICHGFVLWIDWVMDVDNSIVLSTGPDKRYWKQGIKLLAKPVTVGIHGSSRGNISVEIEASFNPSNGEIDIKYAFT